MKKTDFDSGALPEVEKPKTVKEIHADFNDWVQELFSVPFLQYVKEEDKFLNEQQSTQL